MGNEQMCRQCETVNTNDHLSTPSRPPNRPPIILTSHTTPNTLQNTSFTPPSSTSAIRNRIQYQNGLQYDGDTVNGLKHGLGIMRWPSGAYYQGQWQNDRPFGKGKYVKGAVYQGYFRDQSIVEGTYTSENGEEVYNGEFRDNKFDGFGRWEKKNKFVYQGYFKNHQRNGKGKLILADNSTYQGDFLNNKFQGFGSYSSSTHHYEGQFKDGVPHGQGTYRWPNGNYYQGEYVKGLKEGFGVYVLASGARFEGEWAKGQRNGRGVEIDVNGKRQEGYYKEGVKETSNADETRYY